MEFSANPLAFITSRRLFIYGTPSGNEKVRNQAAASFENNLDVGFQYQANEDRFCFTRVPNVQNGSHHMISAVSVVALHWSDVPGRGAVPMPPPEAALDVRRHARHSLQRRPDVDADDAIHWLLVLLSRGRRDALCGAHLACG